MVTTRRSSRLQQLIQDRVNGSQQQPKGSSRKSLSSADTEAEPSTPVIERVLPDGRRLKSALKIPLPPSAPGTTGMNGDCLVNPQEAAVKRHVRINSGNNLVHVFHGSAASQHDGAEELQDSSASGRSRRSTQQLPGVLLAATMLGVWSMASSFLVFYNRDILKLRGFPFPALLAGSSQLGCGILGWMAGAAGLTPVRPMPPWPETLRRLLPLAVAFMSCLFLGNFAYLTLSVAFLNILKALTPAVTLVVSAAAGMERLTLAGLASTLVIAYGTALATIDEAAGVDFHWLAFASFGTSILFEALRVVLTARLLGDLERPYNPVELLSHVGPLAFGITVLASWSTEGAALRQLGWSSVLSVLPALVTVSVLSFLVNITSFHAINLTSSTTFKVAGAFKNAAVVWLSVLQGDSVTRRQAQGFALSLSGFLMYTLARSSSMAAQQQRRQQRGSAKKRT